MPKTVAKRLREMRGASEISRGMMADFLKVKIDTVIAFEMEDRAPSLFLVLGYLEKLKVAPRMRQQLLGDLVYERLLMNTHDYNPRATKLIGDALVDAMTDMRPRGRR